MCVCLCVSVSVCCARQEHRTLSWCLHASSVRVTYNNSKRSQTKPWTKPDIPLPTIYPTPTPPCTLHYVLPFLRIYMYCIHTQYIYINIYIVYIYNVQYVQYSVLFYLYACPDICAFWAHICAILAYICAIWRISIYVFLHIYIIYMIYVCVHFLCIYTIYIYKCISRCSRHFWRQTVWQWASSCTVKSSPWTRRLNRYSLSRSLAALRFKSRRCLCGRALKRGGGECAFRPTVVSKGGGYMHVMCV